MAPKALPSQEVLRQIVRYEPNTGKLFWLERPECMFATKRAYGLWNTRFAGKEAFTVAEAGGHLVGKIFRSSFKAHRVIWKLVHGIDPCDVIDHKNGMPADNRLENLREATVKQNTRNRKARRGSASGYRGVAWHHKTQSWAAVIGSDSKTRHIGLFKNAEDAARAYDAAARELHGVFARPNFSE